jgi:predicted metal-binding protein
MNRLPYIKEKTSLQLREKKILFFIKKIQKKTTKAASTHEMQIKPLDCLHNQRRN